MLFAVATMVVTGVSAWLAYAGVRRAFETEFERRLVQLAEVAASQIDPAHLADARTRGDEGAGYGEIQSLLVMLRSTTGLANATLVDTAGVTLCDARDPEIMQGLPSPLDTLAHADLTRALAGQWRVSAPFRWQGRTVRAGFAPVRPPGDRVLGVVAVEAEPSYIPVLSEFGRRLALVALVGALAIATLAGLILRLAWSAVRLERRLSRAENLAAMGRLTATLAHEIKNPLAIIRGSAERLGKLDGEARRLSEFVVEETDRLSRTVARYLEFARGAPESEVGTPGLPADTGDALQTLRQTLDLLEGECRGRRVALEAPQARAGSAPYPVALDNESLKQVYLNLILNALEAMTEGGTLRVATAERKGAIEVTITDTGPGMDRETLSRLGSPFFTTKAKGSGLGLFLTRRLVRGAGGELEFRSGVGAGTACTVRLPRRRGARGADGWPVA